MQIFVQTQKDVKITLKVEPTYKIEYVKKKIEDIENIPSKMQSLTFNNTQLENKNTLQDYKIENGSTVYLVVLMTFIIRLPSGRERTFTCQKNTKINDIKEFASNEMQVNPVQLDVVYEGKRLEDDETIESSGIKGNTIIFIFSIYT